MEDIIFNFIKLEKLRQINSISLISSENYVSNNIIKAIGNILTNKYAEGYPGNRYYAGCEIIDMIEDETINRGKKVFNVDYINVQPHSGSQANSAVYMALLKPNDKILGFNLKHGGHLTHGSKINFSGKIYNSINYGVDKLSHLIDYDEVLKLAKLHKPKIIICGGSSYSRDINYKKFRYISDEIGSILIADISHTAGLIISKLLNNPFKHCHIVTSTTQKTLRGPRGGLIMINKEFIYKNILASKLINSSVFPGVQGGPFENIIAAKGIMFKEILNKNFVNYSKQVIINSKLMAFYLKELNYNIISHGTDNNCILIDLRNKKITGKEAEKTLNKINIICNKNLIPFDKKKSNITSGIRIGTSAITTRGINENHIKLIVNWIDSALNNKDNNNYLYRIKNEVINFISSFPLFNK